ncbi:anti-sigma factor family protein [Oceanibium sediminis]|uniref:anti-sigma factor family protein n=1 Tax=Oceanibium sediminis TaxID=2026339 RepID=UPI000DD306C3|nr:hypothetical protein [Oceanibium sediminis]
MMISDDDLELVSAFHDGELDPAQAGVLRARLEREPALREALDGIQGVSAALKGLRPDIAALPGPVATRAPKLAVLAIAACLALTVALVSVTFGARSSAPATPLDWHGHFVAQSYVGDGVLHPAAGTRWMGQQPDLSAANLTLVDFAKAGSGGFFLHYSGVNGCRLTFGTHTAAPRLPGRDPDLLIASWSGGELHYSVLAVGMDADRFHAIAALLKEDTERESPAAPLFAAARDATNQAVPCA